MDWQRDPQCPRLLRHSARRDQLQRRGRDHRLEGSTTAGLASPTQLPTLIVSPTPGLPQAPHSVRRWRLIFARRFRSMTEHSVVIAGGGPTGMMLAAELTLAGTDVLIVERRASFKLESSRSRGLHSRTIEVLDQRGVVDRFLAEGKAMQVQAFAGIPMDISDS